MCSYGQRLVASAHRTMDMLRTRNPILTVSLLLLSVDPGRVFCQSPQTGTDPFADLPAPSKTQPAMEETSHSWIHTFFSDNFGFRKEIMSQFGTDERGNAASRQSVGCE